MTAETCRTCGVKHRAGTTCAVAIREAAREDLGREILAILRQLPAGVVVLADSRARATARTLESGEALVRRFSDACEDSDWGDTEDAAGLVRYCRDVGGYVPSSYGYPADADWVYVVAAEGRVVILAERGRTQARPHGRGTCPNRLPSLAAIGDAIKNGARYSAAVVAAARAQARINRLASAECRPSLSPEQAVEVDRALESGWAASA